MATIDWAVVDDVKAAIVANRLAVLSRDFEHENASHVQTLWALSDDDRKALAKKDRLARIMGTVAFHLMTSGKIPEALTLFDALVDTTDLSELSVYNNALWAVQDANHHLGVMKERVESYLARCLPYGPRNPAIFHNAACVYSELGDSERALAAVRDAIRFGYGELDALRDDVSLKQISEDPRFGAAFQDPALFQERRWNVLPGPLQALHALGQDALPDLDLEMRPSFLTAEETLQWIRDWTGQEDPAADKLRPFGQDGSGGTVALWRVEPQTQLEACPVVFFGSEGDMGVVARDLPDFLLLLAGGLGPHEIVENGSTEGQPIGAVQEILKRAYPGAAARSVEQALEDATAIAEHFKSAFPLNG
jgi:hypothetical protein